jgi:hypothetical protein
MTAEGLDRTAGAQLSAAAEPGTAAPPAASPTAAARTGNRAARPARCRCCGTGFRKIDRWGTIEQRRFGTDALRRILACGRRAGSAGPESGSMTTAAAKATAAADIALDGRFASRVGSVRCTFEFLAEIEPTG